MLTRHAVGGSWSLLLVFLLIVPGCGDKARNYTPSVSTAEGALKQGLDAWQAGQPSGEIPDARPAIHVVDAGRKPGQTLVGYRILGETSHPEVACPDGASNSYGQSRRSRNRKGRNRHRNPNSNRTEFGLQRHESPTVGQDTDSRSIGGTQDLNQA